MEILVYPDPTAVARAAADFIERHARESIAVSQHFLFAVSGGSTPWKMLADLGQRDLPWEQAQIFQVDERVAPDGSPDRNWTHLQQSLAPVWNRIGSRAHAMPVADSDLEAAASQYAAHLIEAAGNPPRLDLIHLGLGADGHTASLTPKDPALGIRDRDVAITLTYQGHQRMTLTFTAINRARQILWVVTGADKRRALTLLLNGDSSIPAAHVSDDNATVIADAAAVGSGSQ
jgi:6-phosphogluconolactonase